MIQGVGVGDMVTWHSHQEKKVIVADRDIWTSGNRDIGNARLLFFRQYQIQPVTALL
jgi:hypothetical protein